MSGADSAGAARPGAALAAGAGLTTGTGVASGGGDGTSAATSDTTMTKPIRTIEGYLRPCGAHPAVR